MVQQESHIVQLIDQYNLRSRKVERPPLPLLGMKESALKSYREKERHYEEESRQKFIEAWQNSGIEISNEKISEIEDIFGPKEVKVYVEALVEGGSDADLLDDILSLQDTLNNKNLGLPNFGTYFQTISLIQSKTKETTKEIIEKIGLIAEKVNPNLIEAHPEVTGDFAKRLRQFYPDLEITNDDLNKTPSLFFSQGSFEENNLYNHDFIPLLYMLNSTDFIEELDSKLQEKTQNQIQLIVERDKMGSKGELTLVMLPKKDRQFTLEEIAKLPHGPFIGVAHITQATIDGKNYLSVETYQTDLLKREIRNEIDKSLRNHYTGHDRWAKNFLSTIEEIANELGFDGVIIPDIEQVTKRYGGMMDYRGWLNRADEDSKKENPTYRLYHSIPEKRGYKLNEEVEIDYQIRIEKRDDSDHVGKEGSFWIKNFD